jgi:hypothetical protein
MRDGETEKLNELIREINEARAKKGYPPFDYAEQNGAGAKTRAKQKTQSAGQREEKKTGKGRSRGRGKA